MEEVFWHWDGVSDFRYSVSPVKDEDLVWARVSVSAICVCVRVIEDVNGLLLILILACSLSGGIPPGEINHEGGRGATDTQSLPSLSLSLSLSLP